MEGTPLHSVPARVPGPVDAAEAVAHVEAKLPELASLPQRALALVEIAGRQRARAAEELEVSAAELSRLLAIGRKALRRTVEQLPAGGWCERAERLISDRLDGALTPSGAARLDAHMRSCERCIAHERKLAQAHDLLVESFVAARVAPAPALEAGAPVAELRLVDEPPDREARHLWPVASGPWPRQLAVVLVLLMVLAAGILGLLAATGVLANVP